MDLKELRSELHTRTVTVTFKKVNGDIRIMDCTTNPDLIPPSGWPQGKVQISEETSERTVRVYDVKAQGWRSFVFENVIEVK
jgi:hypothetical protein